jgi:hypothetical protein
MARVKEVATRQAPFAAFLGCADSRVPIEIVFDQGFRDLCVTRIAGNVATNENIGSLEFGTSVLEAKVPYFPGHTSCGEVIQALKGDEVPGQISGLLQHLRPAVEQSRGNLTIAVQSGPDVGGILAVAGNCPFYVRPSVPMFRDKFVRGGRLFRDKFVRGGRFPLGRIDDIHVG